MSGRREAGPSRIILPPRHAFTLHHHAFADRSAAASPAQLARQMMLDIADAFLFARRSRAFIRAPGASFCRDAVRRAAYHFRRRRHADDRRDAPRAYSSPDASRRCCAFCRHHDNGQRLLSSASCCAYRIAAKIERRARPPANIVRISAFTPKQRSLKIEAH